MRQARIPNPDNLPFMGDYKALRTSREITWAGKSVTVELWKAPRCIVQGDGFDWIAEANRWITVKVKPDHLNVIIHLHGDNLHGAIERAEQFLKDTDDDQEN